MCDCHNSGAANAYGGIHGSKVNTYTDGMGNTTKAMRFLPGLGNAMYVPGTLGGISTGSTATFLRYSANGDRTSAAELPVRANNITATNKNSGSFTYTTGGISDDTNWEQKVGSQGNNSVADSTQAIAQGAGYYKLGNPTTKVGGNTDITKGPVWGDGTGATIPSRNAATSAITPLSQNGGASTPAGLLENWGGCEDHNAVQGGGTSMYKRIVRPVTY